MYQSGRAGDEAKKRKSPAKSGRVGIYGIIDMHNGSFLETVEFKTTTGRDLQKLLLFKKLIFNL